MKNSSNKGSSCRIRNYTEEKRIRTAMTIYIQYRHSLNNAYLLVNVTARLVDQQGTDYYLYSFKLNDETLPV